MLSSRFNRFISRLLIAALLAAQGLLAAHACDKLGAGPMAMSMAAQAADAASDVEDVGAMHEACCAPTTLCHEHCKGEPGTTDSGGGVATLDFVAAFSLPISVVDASPPAAAPLEPALAHATSPPASIRHCCWRL